MNRRDLFGFLSIAPVLVATAVVSESQAEEKPEESSRQLLQLSLNNRYISMSVGRDGNLWLKSTGGDWKRVVTE